MRSRCLALGLMLSLAFALTGCGSGTSTASQEPTGSGIRLFGVDGNMTDAFGDEFKDPRVITDMVGTTAMTRLPDSFIARLRSINPKISGFNYAGETYDAVVIATLAAALARSTEAAAMSKYVVGITTQSPGDVTCTTVAACLSAIDAGKDIAYQGITVRNGFTDAGEPSAASYGTRHFGRDYKIDEGKTEYVIAGDDSKASTKVPPRPAPALNRTYRGPALKLGVLLPRTGDLAFQGPPMFAAAELAIADVNAAGGVLGKKIESMEADDGTSVDKAVAAVGQFASENVQVIIGPSTSSESVAVIPKAVAANMLVISGSATSDKLSTVEDHGMFFRTAPPDIFQAHAISDVIMRSGTLKIFIVARDDAYGTPLAETVSTDLAAAGIKKANMKTASYTDQQKDFSSIADQVKSFAPDAVLLVGYRESAKIIQAIQARTRIEVVP